MAYCVFRLYIWIHEWPAREEENDPNFSIKLSLLKTVWSRDLQRVVHTILHSLMCTAYSYVMHVNQVGSTTYCTSETYARLRYSACGDLLMVALILHTTYCPITLRALKMHIIQLAVIKLNFGGLVPNGRCKKNLTVFLIRQYHASAVTITSHPRNKFWRTCNARVHTPFSACKVNIDHRSTTRMRTSALEVCYALNHSQSLLCGFVFSPSYVEVINKITAFLNFSRTLREYSIAILIQEKDVCSGQRRYRTDNRSRLSFSHCYICILLIDSTPPFGWTLIRHWHLLSTGPRTAYTYGWLQEADWHSLTNLALKIPDNNSCPTNIRTSAGSTQSSSMSCQVE